MSRGNLHRVDNPPILLGPPVIRGSFVFYRRPCNAEILKRSIFGLLLFSSTAPKSPPEKTRYDTSLGLLTKKFVDLLAQSPDGVLDLNLAAETLQVVSDQS